MLWGTGENPFFRWFEGVHFAYTCTLYAKFIQTVPVIFLEEFTHNPSSLQVFLLIIRDVLLTLTVFICIILVFTVKQENQ